MRRIADRPPCTRRCPQGEHRHYLEGDLRTIRYTLEPRLCRRYDNHWHGVDVIAPAGLRERVLRQLARRGR